MAKDNKKVDTGTEDDNIPRPAVEAMRTHLETDFAAVEVKESSEPLMLIAFALVDVARGESVVELRKVVVQGAPPSSDREARIKYVAQIKRMRDAADTALVLAQELASGV